MEKSEKNIKIIKKSLEKIDNFNMYDNALVEDKKCYMIQNSNKTIYFNIVNNKVNVICGDLICSDGWIDYDAEELQEIEIVLNNLIKPLK